MTGYFFQTRFRVAIFEMVDLEIGGGTIEEHWRSGNL